MWKNQSHNMFKLLKLCREWFRESCLFAKEPSVSNGKLDDPMNKLDDTMCKQLQELLNEPESIQIIASRFCS